MTTPTAGFEAHVHFLNPSCLGLTLDQFTAELRSSGYTSLSISSYQGSVAHFGTWLQHKRMGLDDIDEKVVANFANHQCTCLGYRQYKMLSRRYVARVRRFVTYLNEHGAVDIAQKKPQETRPVSVIEFSDWMLRHRGLSPQTIERYEYSILALLPELGNQPAHYDAARIRRAIEIKASGYSRATAQKFATALRAYLRFLISQGRCRSNLVAAVPTFPQWRLATLPRYLVAEEFERVIAAYEDNARCGLRNHAILLLLARLGLRAGDVVNMRLDDIDWNAGTLRVHGKGRRSVRLPLPQDAGDAVLAYLQRGRPNVAIDRIFLCVPAPHRAFPSSGVVSGIVRGALTRADIVNPPSWGANLLRHSAATSMLRAGTTLDVISSVLRHRSLDTTGHYAKVDINMLQPIALPWPEEDMSC